MAQLYDMPLEELKNISLRLQNRKILMSFGKKALKSWLKFL